MRVFLRLRYGPCSAPASPQAFSPPDIGNLALWLDASDMATITQVMGMVSQWDDKSLNGYHFIQSVASQQPVTGLRSINMLNVIEFDGVNDRLQINTDFGNLAHGGNTVFVVAQSHALSGTNYMLSAGVINPPSYGLWLATQSYSVRNGVASAADIIRDTNNHIYGFTRSAGILTPFMDGSALAGITSASNADISLARIGGSSGGNSAYWSGAIAEIIIYNASLSTENTNRVGQYLAKKWGTLWAGL